MVQKNIFLKVGLTPKWVSHLFNDIHSKFTPLNFQHEGMVEG